MNPLRRLLEALTRDADAHAARARAVAASLKALRGDVRAMRRDMIAVAARAEALSRLVAQVHRLQEGGRDVPAVLDGLAAVLDADRVTSHVHAAVEGADRLDGRLEIAALWPDDVYDVLTAAIPDPVFFEGVPMAAQTLRVPPRLAPAGAIATWTFVAGVVESVIVPRAAARLRVGDGSPRTPAVEGEPLHVAPGRLVRRPPGSSAPPHVAKPWHWGHVVLDLTSRHVAPAAANRAVAEVASSGGDLAPPLVSGVRHSYEVWFGSKPA